MKNLFIKYKEIILYIVFGLLTTIVSWGSYALFVNMFSISVEISNALSWVCSVTFAYVTNKLWVFESAAHGAKAVIKEAAAFLSSRAVTGAVEILGVPLLAKSGFDIIFFSLAENIGVSEGIFFTDGIYSKMVFAVVVTVLNYVLSKLIVFKKRAETKS